MTHAEDIHPNLSAANFAAVDSEQKSSARPLMVLMSCGHVKKVRNYFFSLYGELLSFRL